MRGHGDRPPLTGTAYHQDHLPFRELDEIVGHAVRAVYLACGVADLYAETGEARCWRRVHRLWARASRRKMYVSGGLGSRWDGESFGADYELPNARGLHRDVRRDRRA